MVERHQILAPILRPFNGSAEQPRRERHEIILRIKLAARPKAAADIVFDHAHRRLRQPHHLGQHAAIGERHLGRTAHRHALSICVPNGQQPARLHWHGRVTLHAKMLAAHIGCVPERRFGVATHRRDRAGEICSGGLEQKHIVLASRIACRDRGQWLDVDDNGLQGVFGNGSAVGDNKRKRLADVTHLFRGNDRLLVALECRQRLLTQGNPRHITDVGCGDHGVNPRPRQRRLRVDRANSAMGDGTAQHHRMQRVYAGKVVDVLAAPGKKAKIFDALDRTADKCVGRALRWDAHMTIVASRLRSALATLSAARADVFGFVFDGLPCS